MADTPSDITTRQRILACAASLFSEKGFTETSIRELAEMADLNPASMYHHFPSKNAILEQLLADYSEGNINIYDEPTITSILREKPNTDGIMACLQTTFPPDRAQYFLKILCVMLQEQLRNPIVCAYISEHIILRAEKKVRTIVDVLMKLGILRQDTDPDYWSKVTSSLSFSFSIRMMLGIGDNAPGYAGKGMAALHRHTFDMLLASNGVQQQGNG